MRFNTIIANAETILSGHRARMPRTHKKAILQERLGVGGRMAGRLVSIVSNTKRNPSTPKKMAPMSAPEHKWALVSKETGEILETFPTRAKAREAKTDSEKVVKIG